MKFRNIATLVFSSIALFACGGGGGGGGDSDDSGFVSPEAPSLNLSATRTVLLPNYSGFGVSDDGVVYVDGTSSQSISYVTARVRQPNGDLYSTGYTISFSISADSLDLASIFCFSAEQDGCLVDTTVNGNSVTVRPPYTAFTFVDAIGDTVIGVVSDSSRQGDVTLTATLTSPDNANVTVTNSITFSVGNGSGDTAGVVWENLGSILTNDQRFINVAIYDETAGAASDPNYNNLSISASGLSDVTITGNNYRGRTVTGSNINVATTEGVSAISILTGSTTGILRLTATADLADNNVDNGIQDPVSATTIISVVSSADQIGNSISLIAATPTIAVVDEEYTYDIPYSGTVSFIELVSGTLPSGLTINGRTIEGIPTEIGQFTFTVIAYAPNGDYDTQEYTITVVSEAELEFENLQDTYTLIVEQQWSTSITVKPHEANATISVRNGSLPPGITLSNGIISGTPTTAGRYAVIFEATASGYTDNVLQTVTFIVEDSSIVLSSITDTATVGTYYSESISLDVDGDYTIVYPVTWALSDGSLPAGLNLNTSSGTISGTPTTAGTYEFTITATDSNGKVGARIYTMTVSP